MNFLIQHFQYFSYKNEVRKYKTIIEDQPIKGVDKAIWWIEYIIRHQRAKHLRNPAIEMPIYQYFMLDIIAFLILAILVGSLCFVKMCMLLKYRFPKIKMD